MTPTSIKLPSDEQLQQKQDQIDLLQHQLEQEQEKLKDAQKQVADIKDLLDIADEKIKKV